MITFLLWISHAFAGYLLFRVLMSIVGYERNQMLTYYCKKKEAKVCFQFKSEKKEKQGGEEQMHILEDLERQNE